MVTRSERTREMRRVTLIGALVNVLLAIGKTGFGFVTQSYALIADGIHSFSDLATDILVMVAANHSNHAADDDHPYGHARIETASTVGLGVVLIAAGVGIAIDAGQRLLTPQLLPTPAPLALLIAAISIAANEGLYRYTMRVGIRVNSPLLRANAWHHRADAVSSVLVVVGVAGALAGMPYLDAFAAVGVALMIAKIGWDQGWHALQELVDRGLDPDRVAEMETAIADVEGVRDLHTLRTRRMGGEALVDVHIQVDPYLSVSEGHQIGEYVRSELQASFDDVSDVTVHVDPEDDEASERCAGLPLRRQVLRQVRSRWKSVLGDVHFERISLHYLNGQIEIDVMLPLTIAGHSDDRAGLGERLRSAVADIPAIRTVRLYYL